MPAIRPATSASSNCAPVAADGHSEIARMDEARRQVFRDLASAFSIDEADARRGRVERDAETEQESRITGRTKATTKLRRVAHDLQRFLAHQRRRSASRADAPNRWASRFVMPPPLVPSARPGR